MNIRETKCVKRYEVDCTMQELSQAEKSKHNLYFLAYQRVPAFCMFLTVKQAEQMREAEEPIIFVASASSIQQKMEETGKFEFEYEV